MLLYDVKRRVRRDIVLFYCGLFLDIVTSFECFIEDLFLNLLIDDEIHPLQSVKAKHVFKSTTSARSVVGAGKNYIDWFPYDFTIKRSKIFFNAGKPFTDFNKADKKYLSEILYIRNALAHLSKHSIKQFNKHLTDGLPLTSKEKSVTGFLRSFYAVAPSQTRYEYYVFQLGYLANKLVQ